MPKLKTFRYDRWAEWVEREISRDRPTAVAVDTETTGVAWADMPFCVTLTWRDRDGHLKSGYVDTDESLERAELVCRVLAQAPTWVFWNAKFDLGMLDKIGALPPIDGHTIEDGQPVAALLDENRRMGLKVRAVEDLGYVNTVEVEVKSGPNKGQTKLVAKEEHHLAAVRRKLGLRKEDGYHPLPREDLIPYALTDTELTLQWWEKYRPTLPAELEPVYAEEIELIHVLRAMEANGVGIDVPYLTEAVDEWGTQVMLQWQKLVALTGRDDFLPSSPKQVLAAFEAAGVTLESTDKAHLRDLLASPSTPKAARELAETLHAYREAEKIHATYLLPLSREQQDGIVHPWFNSVGPRTGRTSSSKVTA